MVYYLLVSIVSVVVGIPILAYMSMFFGTVRVCHKKKKLEDGTIEYNPYTIADI